MYVIAMMIRNTTLCKHQKMSKVTRLPSMPVQLSDDITLGRASRVTGDEVESSHTSAVRSLFTD